jgi:hypothetical protein
VTLNDWLARWQIPAAAAAELHAALVDVPSLLALTGGPQSEQGIQAAVRLEASQHGGRLWRNNVGAMFDQDKGTFMRFGLCNESEAINRKFKSADLIGLRPVTITPAHVGRTLGLFMSREIKHAGWKYTGSPREEAQLRWAQMIVGLGGDAGFATGTGTIIDERNNSNT